MANSPDHPKKLSAVERMQMQCSIHNATWYTVIHIGATIAKDHKKIVRVWEEIIDSCIKSGKHPYQEFVKAWADGQET